MVRLAVVLIVLGVACGGGNKDPYQPRLVGEDRQGPGLAPNSGERSDEGDAKSEGTGETSLTTAKSDAKTSVWFKVRKCSADCVQAWNARSAQTAHAAIERDCKHRCRQQWFTCPAAIDHALELMRKNKLRRDMLLRDGVKDVRDKGLVECRRRRWALETIGCMLKAGSMDAFDDCEDADRERRRRARR